MLSRARPMGVEMLQDDQTRLIEALRNAALYGASEVRLLETHISYVLLTGDYAFKIKKAIRLNFLDFSTLEARRFYCVRELELNRRFAPHLYLQVVPITGTADRPEIAGSGPPIEYAVKMRQFPQDALLGAMLARGALTHAHLDDLAARLSSFHDLAERIDPAVPFGTAAAVRALAMENFTDIDALLGDADDRTDLAALCAWTDWEHHALGPVFDGRRNDGFVRACHGDLHLGNIALVEGIVTMFDGIEFNERMRWGDVMADVAFLVMDLRYRTRPDFAARLFNLYVESTGDYAGVRVFRFYAAYRAMVRAKVARVRSAELVAEDLRAGADAEYRAHVRLALDYTETPHAGLILTHGPSGAGKTTLSEGLLELIGAVRIRTDVERKRLHGVPSLAASQSALDAGLYSHRETERTYERARSLTRDVVAGGFPAIVDGTFLKRWQREMFRQLASELAVPFVIVDFVAAPATMRARIEERRRAASDASEADARVLESQLQSAEAFGEDEGPAVVTYDAATAPEGARQAAVWQPVVARLGRRPSAA